jgi:YD repeat-containing protein
MVLRVQPKAAKKRFRRLFGGQVFFATLVATSAASAEVRVSFVNEGWGSDSGYYNLGERFASGQATCDYYKGLDNNPWQFVSTGPGAGYCNRILMYNPPQFVGYVAYMYDCPTGYTALNYLGWSSVVTKDGTGYCFKGDDVRDAKRNLGECEECKGLRAVGNPINPATGNKYQVEVDYTGAGAFPLQFSRFYNSAPVQNDLFSDKVMGSRNRNGFGWRGYYERWITLRAIGAYSTAYVYRNNGSYEPFTLTGGVWTPQANISGRLEQLMNGNTPSGWRYSAAAGDLVETYDVAGNLVSITNSTGLTQTLSYDGNSRLAAVMDHFGRTLTFTYDGAGRVATMTDPAGGVFTYAYDANANLVSVTYPDTKTRGYVYENATFKHALTGIVDEKGARFATYTYDAQSRATSSEHAGAVDHVGVSSVGGVVTDGLGASRTFTFKDVLGVTKNSGITGAACPDCGPAARTFDVNGNVTARTDWNGNRTNYTFDLTRNLETSRTEGLTAAGATTAATRTIKTQWHSTYRLPTGIAEPFRITTMVYGDAGAANPGDRGSLLSMTFQATTDANGSLGFAATTAGAPRSWTFTYDARGMLLTADGPRLDVSDVTTFTYYAPDDADIGKRGNLATVTNALGQVTTYDAYDLHGRPTSTTDANGVVSTLTYDARGRMLTSTVAGATKAYAYDGVGQLTGVTLPDGSTVSYAYDDAHRMKEMQDAAGNRAVYTYDAMSNLTHLDVYDAGAQLIRTHGWTYNNLGQKTQELDSAGHITAFTYDPEGNVTGVTDAVGQTTTRLYDALQRVIRVTEPGGAQTNLVLNGLNQVLSVSDPRGVVTTRTYDGLGNLLTNTSPDTGTTTYVYDVAGNLSSKTDARAKATTFAYDALNRMTHVTDAAGGESALVYDTGTNAIGRLSNITDVAGTRAFAYDARGRVTMEQRAVTMAYASLGLTTQYAYDEADRVTDITLPSGRAIAYARDVLGQVTKVTTTSGGTTTVLADQIVHPPFGAATSAVGVDGAALNWGQDMDGRVANYTTGSDARTLSYDAAGRLTGVSTGAGSLATYGYDARGRVTSASGPPGAFAYAYDASGNLTSRNTAGTATAFTYAANGNRLVSASGGLTTTYTHDAAGNMTGDGERELSYDARGRLVEVRMGGARTRYVIDTFGHRVARLAD